MHKIIVVNSGSTSKKYALYHDDELQLSFHFEEHRGDPNKPFILNIKKEDSFCKDVAISGKDYEDAFGYAIDFLIDGSYLENKDEIDAVIFRIVAPGAYFASDRIINEEFLEKLDDIRERSPLHIEKMQSEFYQVSKKLNKTKMIGVSDSRFHKTMPKRATIYALPKEITSKYDIKRFGYHGISIAAIVDHIKEEKGQIPEKMIICHLGGGASITALKNGESIETSMGYSPLEGLPMSTRIGNIDIGAAIAMSELMDLDLSDLRKMMYKDCGLRGISGTSDDIRTLLVSVENGDEDAELALDKYAYEVKKIIGAYSAILGGLDWLVLAGTVGERSAPMRKRICNGLESLGIDIDENLNAMTVNDPGFINKPNSTVPVEIIYTNEVKQMIKRAVDLI